MTVFLIGFMGAGKSSLGKEMARITGYTYIDTDTLLEEKHKCTVAEYFERYGEEHFREEEAAILRSIDLNTNSIVATGGGMPCYHNNMEWMNAHGITIYIKQEIDELVNRLKNSENSRPLLKQAKNTPITLYIKQLIAGREGYYTLAKYTFFGPVVSAQTVINTIILECA